MKTFLNRHAVRTGPLAQAIWFCLRATKFGILLAHLSEGKTWNILNCDTIYYFVNLGHQIWSRSPKVVRHWPGWVTNFQN